jgi:hypothetical protein
MATNDNKDTTNSVIRISNDLIGDLLTSFPECCNELTNMKTQLEEPLYVEHCKKIYPQRFFDILYQNDDIFEDDEIDTCFMPNIDFKMFFKADGVSEKTRDVLWQYLQLILFTIIGDVQNAKDFGDTANLFSGIDEGELQDKMKEAFQNMGSVLDNMTNKSDDEKTGEPVEGEETAQEGQQQGGIPKFENIKEHLQSLFEGKIGSLAKELAEEVGDDFKDLLGDEKAQSNPKDIFKKLIRNPKKITDLMKKVSTKLEDKMKSGNISKEELMKEAGDIMKKMKDMGGGKEFGDMMKNMAKTMGGKNARVNMGLFNQMAKENDNRERLLRKLEERRQAKIVEENNKKKFVIEGDEVQQKTAIDPKLMEEIENMTLDNEKQSKPKSSSKKKKNKKKGKK